MIPLIYVIVLVYMYICFMFSFLCSVTLMYFDSSKICQFFINIPFDGLLCLSDLGFLQEKKKRKKEKEIPWKVLYTEFVVQNCCDCVICSVKE